MSGEIEVSETPNWLLELEAKRERRLKARLGHETGAGAPCLKCGDRCPGLDLHFWRKCCKVCKCSKEEHEVPDDDIYGWAQFQLLGSKPNKIKRKILLPGRKDELELDWAPSGNNETVDRYLKTLPPDQLPVKGSQAAQDRKQLLHKQIPIHDIDPELCHDLTNDELSEMNDYIAHVKESSVGVGQLVSLSSIIKGNLHMLTPSEAALLSSRFPKCIPLSDIVKLHSQNKAKDLSQSFQKIRLHSKTLPNYSPNSINTSEQMRPLIPNRIHDRSHSACASEENPPTVQYSAALGRRKTVEAEDQMPFNADNSIDEKHPHNSNFDPKKVPSKFVNEKNRSGQWKASSQLIPSSEQFHSLGAKLSENLNKTIPPGQIKAGFELGDQLHSFGLDCGRGNAASAFVPYSLHNLGTDNNSLLRPNYAVNQQEKQINLNEGVEQAQSFGSMEQNENLNKASSKQLTDSDFQREHDVLHTSRPGMQNFAAGKYNIHSDIQKPISVPKNIKDLAFSTYDPSNVDPNELTNKNIDPIYSLKNPSEPYIANRNLDKEILSKAHPNLLTLLEGRNDIAEDRGTQMGDTGTAGRVKGLKKLSEIFPSSSGVCEDFVYPSDVRIGAIKDIDIEYPEIRAAVEGTNDFCEDYSPDSIKEILNNIKLPDCHHCKKPFEENEFAVTIDRANVLFHAKCFKCAGCNQILVDNMYFYHKETDNIYCGRDYAKVRGVPRCKACDELIFTKEYTLAENATFHLKHFCCIECDTPLADRHYTLDDGMPYCLPCFEQSKANKCSGCLNVIKPDEIGCNLNGIHFHASDECFACKVCRKPLMGQKLLLRDEKLYCSHECYGLVK